MFLKLSKYCDIKTYLGEVTRDMFRNPITGDTIFPSETQIKRLVSTLSYLNLQFDQNQLTVIIKMRIQSEEETVITNRLQSDLQAQWGGFLEFLKGCCRPFTMRLGSLFFLRNQLIAKTKLKITKRVQYKKFAKIQCALLIISRLQKRLTLSPLFVQTSTNII